MNNFTLVSELHFDSYETWDNGTEVLLNVSDYALEKIKEHDIVNVDFDGNGLLIWHVYIDTVDKAGKKIYYTVI